MKIRPVEAEIFHVDEWTDRKTDIKKLVVAFRNFVKALRDTLKLSINIRAARWKSQSWVMKIYVCQYKILK